MRKRIFLLFILLALPILFIWLHGSKTFIWLYDSRAIHISTEPSSSFDVSLDRNSDYYPKQIVAIPNTPYVFCDFINGTEIWQEGGGSFHRYVALVNTEQRKQILSAHWRSWEVGYPFCIYRPPEHHRTEPYLLFANATTPLVLLYERDGLRNPKDQKYYSLEETLYVLSVSGELSKIETIRNFFPIHVSNHVFSFAKPDRVTEEFVIEDGLVKKVDEWRRKSRYFYLLEEKHEIYIGSDWGQPTVPNLEFFSYKAPRDFIITGDELASVYGGQKLEIAKISTISAGIDQPTYFLIHENRLNEDAMHIIECALEISSDKTVTPQFRLIGKEIRMSQWYGIKGISRNGTTLYFHYWKNRKSPLPSHWVTLSRTVNPDGSLGDFETQPKPLEWNTDSYIPFPDNQPYMDRMLFFRNGAFWTMNLDGSNEVQIFPSDGNRKNS